MSAATTPTASPVPYRVLMRAQGLGRRPRKRRQGSAGECVRCGRVGPLTKDHIVPQSRLEDAPQVRDDPSNWQQLCATAHHVFSSSGRRVVERYGCNELKADGPAVDYRGDPDAHRRLLALLAEHGIEEGVEWAPRHT